jgi:DNA (cytosine-5)-methyltransferase 1
MIAKTRGQRPAAIDLFCGCGGISSGLVAAGFRILAGVDVDARYIATFSHNFRAAKSLLLNIAEVTPKAFMSRVGLKRGELDLLAGGPPCQGFSKNVPRKYRFLEDPRNLLIKEFLDYCEELHPQVVLMENVAEMRNGFDQTYTEEIMSRLADEGYTVTHAVLNAADYGVPQRRRRAFFLANRLGIQFRIPLPTHTKPTESRQGDFLGLPHHVTVWEAIGDLPPLKHGQKRDPTEYACKPFSDYQRLMRGGSKSVRNHIARFLQPTQYARLAALKPGQKHKDLPEELQVNGGYSGAYGRLTKEMIAPTITRWVFHPGSGRWGHPVDVRVLSIREVARIQGFPDAFDFVGTYTQQAGQLGNAVPPLLARRIAEAMVDQVEVALSRSARKASTLSLSESEGKVNVTL